MKKLVKKQKKSNDTKSFMIFVAAAAGVVTIASFPWILAVAGFLAAALYFTNPKFKSWVNSKLHIKGKEEKIDFPAPVVKTTMKQSTVIDFDKVTTSQLIAELTRRGQVK